MGQHYKLRRKRNKNSGLTLEELRSRKSTEIAVCLTCGLNEEPVNAGNKLVMCSPCIQKQVAPPPAPKAPLTPEEKELRVARKLERAKRKVAKEQGVVIAPKDLGFIKGWHRRKLFKTEISEQGKQIEVRYFSLGKEITQKEYDALATEELNRELSKVKATAGWGRGWHLKAEFVAPDGTVYKKGKKVS